MTESSEKTEPGFDIVMIGNFSRDRNIERGVERVMAGGAVFFGSIPAARLGAKVAVVTRAAREDAPLMKLMTDNGVALFHIESEKSTSIENRYLDDTLERRVSTPLSFAGGYDESMLPAAGAKIYHVAGLMRGEADLGLLRALAARGRLSADAQGFVRVIRGDRMEYEDWPEKRDALPLMDFFKTDALEAEILTGETDVSAAARALAAMGAREIVLTHPGGVLVHADGEQVNAPFTARTVLGRTGRGDTTMASYLTRRLTHPPADACRFAAAAVSIKMESTGPFNSTLDSVLERARETDLKISDK